MSTVAILKKRRKATYASITHPANCLNKLKGQTDQPHTLHLAHQLKSKLADLDSETHHSGLVELIDDESTLEAE